MTPKRDEPSSVATTNRIFTSNFIVSFAWAQHRCATNAQNIYSYEAMTDIDWTHAENDRRDIDRHRTTDRQTDRPIPHNSYTCVSLKTRREEIRSDVGLYVRHVCVQSICRHNTGHGRIIYKYKLCGPGHVERMRSLIPFRACAHTLA